MNYYSKISSRKVTNRVEIELKVSSNLVVDRKVANHY